MKREVINVPYLSLSGESLAGPSFSSSHNKVLSVIKNTETIITTMTVPAEKSFYLNGVSAGSMTDTEFVLYINDAPFEILHNAWTERNVYFHAKHVILEAGTIKITGKHGSNQVHDFFATIIGVLL